MYERVFDPSDIDAVGGFVHNPGTFTVAAVDGTAGPELEGLFSKFPPSTPVTLNLKPDGPFPPPPWSNRVFPSGTTPTGAGVTHNTASLGGLSSRGHRQKVDSRTHKKRVGWLASFSE
ncbi:MAG: hypothetical protein WCF90_07700, partial [Methanomicrobiales archaeon]